MHRLKWETGLISPTHSIWALYPFCHLPEERAIEEGRGREQRGAAGEGSSVGLEISAPNTTAHPELSTYRPSTVTSISGEYSVTLVFPEAIAGLCEGISWELQKVKMRKEATKVWKSWNTHKNPLTHANKADKEITFYPAMTGVLQFVPQSIRNKCARSNPLYAPL